MSDGGVAPWLDAFWSADSYPNDRFANSDSRYQTQVGKHLMFVNNVYADGHAKSPRPSQIK